MSKTQLTKDIEKALFYYTKAHLLGVYGAFEVSLGSGYGKERVDYMTMSSTNEFRCYEIKVSKADFNSNAALSFEGDFNYFVISLELYEDLKKSGNISMQYHDIGILTAYNSPNGDMKIYEQRKAKRKTMRIGDKTNLMHCMIRSLSRLTKKEIEDENIKSNS